MLEEAKKEKDEEKELKKDKVHKIERKEIIWKTQTKGKRFDKKGRPIAHSFRRLGYAPGETKEGQERVVGRWRLSDEPTESFYKEMDRKNGKLKESVIMSFEDFLKKREGK